MTVQVVTDNTTVQNASADEQFTGFVDAELNANLPDTNFGNTGGMATNGNLNRGVLEPDLSNVPEGVTINSATLYLYRSDGFQATPFDVGVFRLLRDWVEAEATWNIYSTGNSWQTAGAAGANDREGTALDTTSIPNSAAYYSWDVTSWVQDVVDSAITNQGILIDRTDGADSKYRTFASSEGTDGQRPEIVIDYTEASSSTDFVAPLPMRIVRHSGRYH